MIQEEQLCGMVGEVKSVESGFGRWGRTSCLIAREYKMELRRQESRPKLLRWAETSSPKLAIGRQLSTVW